LYSILEDRISFLKLLADFAIVLKILFVDYSMDFRVHEKDSFSEV